MGGTEIGEDLGYGPARYVPADEVKEIYKELEQITEEELRKRFDPGKFKEFKIYPFGGYFKEDDLEYLVQHFKRLKDFYKRTVDKGEAMLKFFE